MSICKQPIRKLQTTRYSCKNVALIVFILTKKLTRKKVINETEL